MTETVSVSIIICTCNRAEYLRQTLVSMAFLHIPVDLIAELIVVDNASEDHTAHVVASCNLPNMSVRYVREPRRGQCRARNLGIDVAQGQIILFTDDDVRPSPDWVIQMCSPIIAGEADAVAGRVTLAPHLIRSWMTETHKVWFAASEADISNAPMLVGANMAFHKRVVEKVPAFDVELGPGALGFCDDSVFSEQIVLAGYKIVSTEKGCVEHHFDETRLRRSSLLDFASRYAASLAYMSYHCQHIQIIAPWPRMIKNTISLFLWRKRNRSACAEQEGLSIDEYRLVSIINYYNQYMIERARPHNYSKLGLVKRNYLNNN